MKNTKACNVRVFVFKTQVFHANRSTANLTPICHFQHHPNSHVGQGEAHKSTVTQLYQTGPENSADSSQKINAKSKAKAQTQDLGLSMNVDTACRSVHKWECCSHIMVSERTTHKGREGSSRAYAPGCVLSETPGSAHDHTLATTRDILTPYSQEALKGEKFTTRIFQQL